jgi:hypothetical protein
MLFCSQGYDNDDDDLVPHTYLYTFVTLQLVGGTGLLAILITAVLSKNVTRLVTWVSLIASLVSAAHRTKALSLSHRIGHLGGVLHTTVSKSVARSQYSQC